MKDDSPSYNLRDNNFTIGIASMKAIYNYVFDPETDNFNAEIHMESVDLSNLFDFIAYEYTVNSTGAWVHETKPI